MTITQLLIVGGGLMSMRVLLYLAFAGTSPAKESQRRLQSVRYRHSDSAQDRVESQLKKAIAARKPSRYKAAGSGSRAEALRIRLDRTGKGYTLAQYAYASIGLGLVVAALVYLRSGAVGLALGVGVLAGAGIPHFLVNRAIKKRTARFNAKFPDAIELLVRGLRSGLPVSETLNVVASE